MVLAYPARVSTSVVYALNDSRRWMGLSFCWAAHWMNLIWDGAVFRCTRVNCYELKTRAVAAVSGHTAAVCRDFIHS